MRVWPQVLDSPADLAKTARGRAVVQCQGTVRGPQLAAPPADIGAARSQAKPAAQSFSQASAQRRPPKCAIGHAGPMLRGTRFGVESLPGRVFPRLGKAISAHGQAEHCSMSVASANELVERHFAELRMLDHPCYGSMSEALRLLGGARAVILETGMSAWGTNSTQLFDDYVSCFGGEFHTVDIRLTPLLLMRRVVTNRTQLTCDDSVRFLDRWARSNRGRKADLVYLDSFDLNARSPYAAAVHGIREYLAIRPALAEGSLLLVDDTPIDLDSCPREWRHEAESFLEREGVMPGKGMLIVPYLDATHAATKVHHGYQVLYRFDR